MATGGVLVRPATAADAPAITELHAIGWRSGYGEFFPPEVLATEIDGRKTRWTDLAASGRLEEEVIVAADGEDLVGFARVTPSDLYSGAAFIHSFYVHPERWGTGVAGELMAAIVEGAAARGRRAIHLTAYRESARARAFYEKSGFRETGRTFESELSGGVPVTDVEYRLDLDGS